MSRSKIDMQILTRWLHDWLQGSQKRGQNLVIPVEEAMFQLNDLRLFVKEEMSRKDHMNKRMDRLEVDLAAAESASEDAKAQLKRLRQELSDREREKRVENDTIRELNHIITTNKGDIDRLIHNTAKLEKQLDFEKNSHHQYVKDLCSKDTEINNLKNEKTVQVTENERLRSDIVSLKEQVAALEAQAEIRLEGMREVEGKNESLNSSLKVYERELERARSDRAVLENRILEIESLSTLKHEQREANLEANLLTVRAELAAVTADKMVAEERVSGLTERLQERDRDAKEQERELERAMKAKEQKITDLEVDSKRVLESLNEARLKMEKMSMDINRLQDVGKEASELYNKLALEKDHADAANAAEISSLKESLRLIQIDATATVKDRDSLNELIRASVLVKPGDLSSMKQCINRLHGISKEAAAKIVVAAFSDASYKLQPVDEGADEDDMQDYINSSTIDQDMIATVSIRDIDFMLRLLTRSVNTLATSARNIAEKLKQETEQSRVTSVAHNEELASAQAKQATLKEVVDSLEYQMRGQATEEGVDVLTQQATVATAGASEVPSMRRHADEDSMVASTQRRVSNCAEKLLVLYKAAFFSLLQQSPATSSTSSRPQADLRRSLPTIKPSAFPFLNSSFDHDFPPSLGLSLAEALHGSKYRVEIESLEDELAFLRRRLKRAEIDENYDTTKRTQRSDAPAEGQFRKGGFSVCSVCGAGAIGLGNDGNGYLNNTPKRITIVHDFEGASVYRAAPNPLVVPAATASAECAELQARVEPPRAPYATQPRPQPETVPAPAILKYSNSPSASTEAASISTPTEDVQPASFQVSPAPAVMDNVAIERQVDVPPSEDTSAALVVQPIDPPPPIPNPITASTLLLAMPPLAQPAPALRQRSGRLSAMASKIKIAQAVLKKPPVPPASAALPPFPTPESHPAQHKGEFVVKNVPDEFLRMLSESTSVQQEAAQLYRKAIQDSRDSIALEKELGL